MLARLAANGQERPCEVCRPGGVHGSLRDCTATHAGRPDCECHLIEVSPETFAFPAVSDALP